MQPTTITNHVTQVTAKAATLTQHLTTTSDWTDHLFANTILLVVLGFATYLVFVLCLGIWADSHYGPIARKVMRFADSEFRGLERIGHRFTNRYWYLRCLLSKRWWQKRRHFKSKPTFGMSWEGKEKAYMQRYSQTKD